LISGGRSEVPKLERSPETLTKKPIEVQEENFPIIRGIEKCPELWHVLEIARRLEGIHQKTGVLIAGYNPFFASKLLDRVGREGENSILAEIPEDEEWAALLLEIFQQNRGKNPQAPRAEEWTTSNGVYIPGNTRTVLRAPFFIPEGKASSELKDGSILWKEGGDFANIRHAVNKQERQEVRTRLESFFNKIDVSLEWEGNLPVSGASDQDIYAKLEIREPVKV